MKPDNYCLVTQRIGAILEDSPDDSDRTPDYTDVNGDVLFTPIMARGDAFHIERDGEIVTVPVYSVRAKIVDGVLQHEGEVGIPLFAGGEGVNPSSLVYRVVYSRLKANGENVELNSLSFKAIPGGTVDLTTVTPVAGTPSPGITKGDKGDRGEQGPQGEVGPQGDPGEVTLAQLNQAIRIDTSVGTRAFAGDTMIFGDTGWRNVTPGGYTGTLSARRVGEMVMVRLAALAPPEDVVIPTIASLTPGFQSAGRVMGPITRLNSLGVQGRLWIEGGLVRVVVGTGTKIDDPYTPSHQYTGVEIYPTNDPWPTTLPGTPA